MRFHANSGAFWGFTVFDGEKEKYQKRIKNITKKIETTKNKLMKSADDATLHTKEESQQLLCELAKQYATRAFLYSKYHSNLSQTSLDYLESLKLKDNKQVEQRFNSFLNNYQPSSIFKFLENSCLPQKELTILLSLQDKETMMGRWLHKRTKSKYFFYDIKLQAEHAYKINKINTYLTNRIETLSTIVTNAYLKEKIFLLLLVLKSPQSIFNSIPLDLLKNIAYRIDDQFGKDSSFEGITLDLYNNIADLLRENNNQEKKNILKFKL